MCGYYVALKRDRWNSWLKYIKKKNTIILPTNENYWNIGMLYECGPPFRYGETDEQIRYSMGNFFRIGHEN